MASGSVSLSNSEIPIAHVLSSGPCHSMHRVVLAHPNAWSGKVMTFSDVLFQPKWTDMNSASNHCISEERCGWCWFSVLLHAATIIRKKSWTGSSALQSCLLERIPFGLLRKPSSSESTESLGQESLMHRQVPKMASPWLLCYYKQWAHAQNNAAEKLDMLVTGTSRRSIQLAVELPLKTYLLPDINSLTNAL